MRREPASPARKTVHGENGGRAQLFERAFEAAPQAIVVAQDDRFVVVNRTAERITGRSRQRLVEEPVDDLIHPDDREMVRRRIAARLAGDALEEVATFRLIDEQGATRWIESRASRVEWNSRPAVLAFLEDVTDRERERRAAAELSHLLERVADVAPYFIFIFDYDLGRDVYINRPVAETLGFEGAEAAALGPYPFASLCHPDDYARAMERDPRWKDIADGEVDAVEFRMRNQAGEWRWFRSHNTPFLRDAGGRVRQMLGVSIDITELRRSQEALKRSEKLESIGLLAGGLAHDFGNLLTPVLGHSDLLLRKLGEGSELRSHVEAIRQAAARASELVEQLLLVSGRGEFRAQPIELDALVVEVAAMLEPLLPPEISLSTEIAADLPAVAGDALQLRQVLLNLVGNASDALAGRGGSIIVRALSIDVDDTLASLLALRERFAPGPALLLEVEDDGPGMDEATRERLLEPFFTTKPKGRGLGLASVVGIVRRHRGGLAVDSNPGRGTVFRILLPLAERPVSPAATGGG